MEAFDDKEKLYPIRHFRRDYGKRNDRRLRKTNCYELDARGSGRSVTDATADPARAHDGITKLGNLRLGADRQGPESRPLLCYTRARIDGTLFWRALVGRKWADRPCYVSRPERCAGGSIPVLL